MLASKSYQWTLMNVLELIFCFRCPVTWVTFWCEVLEEGVWIRIQHRHIPFTYSSDKHLYMIMLKNQKLGSNTLPQYVTKIILI